MLGHLMEWFYSGLGGIRQAKNSSGFQKIAIRPEPVGDVIRAEANYLSPYGNISTKWKKENGSFALHTEIPVNTTAVIYLPASEKSKITESGKPISGSDDVKILKYENGKVLIAVGSGDYDFQVK